MKGEIKKVRGWQRGWFLIVVEKFKYLNTKKGFYIFISTFAFLSKFILLAPSNLSTNIDWQFS